MRCRPEKSFRETEKQETDDAPSREERRQQKTKRERAKKIEAEHGVCSWADEQNEEDRDQAACER